MNDQSLNNMQNNVSIARGFILNEVVLLESAVEMYLSLYFAQKGTREVFMHHFLSQIGFSKKLDIFRITIAKKKNTFTANNPSFSIDLGRLIKDRNAFAHEVINISDVSEVEYAANKTFSFINFKKPKAKAKRYSPKEIQEIIDLSRKYYNELTDYNQKLYSSSSPL